MLPNTRRESEHRQRKRKTSPSVPETEQERAARLTKERERRAQHRAQSSALVVHPFKEWCVLRGLSEANARRLIACGRLKATHLSERRIGIRSDHDQEYLDSCARVGA